MIAHVELGRTIRMSRYMYSSDTTILIQGSDHRAPVTSVAEHIKNPKLADLIQRFLYHQLSSDSRLDSNASSSEASSLSGRLPTFNGKMFLHSSASSIFFAPSDPSGIHGFSREQIQSSWSWWGGSPRQDVVLVNTGDGGNNELPMSGYSAARVLLFFSFKYSGQHFPVALVWWYTLSDDTGRRDEATGMWLVEREYRNEEPFLAVVHVDSIFRAVHLLPFFGRERVPQGFSHSDTLDTYAMFYVNRFADHHSFEIL